MSIIGNPLLLGGGGSSGVGGTVTITDTLDTHGGTIRTITTNPAATIIEALTATANAVYTPAAGHAYGPVTVNVAGVGGLVYETGTYGPSADTISPTINFANAHTSPPSIIIAINITTNEGLVAWYYVNSYSIFNANFYDFQNNACRGLVGYKSVTSSGSGYNYNDGFTQSSISQITESSFTPWARSELSFKAGCTYKWIAIWGAE